MSEPTKELLLPKGWASASIGELISHDGVFVDGDWVESKDQDPNGDVRLIQLADVGDGRYRNRSRRFLTSKKAAELGCTFLEQGDILIARMPAPLGRACIFPGDAKRSVTAVDVCIVRVGSDGVSNNWLMNSINSIEFRAAVASLQSGSTRKRISRGNLATLKLPVPPLEEQKRIVTRIEELFTQLDAGVKELGKARAQLKRHRQVVLKAAVTGELTEEWRETHQGEVEEAAELIARILKERRTKWQADQLVKMKEAGKRPKNDDWKKKYAEPAVPDEDALYELPVGWKWANTGQIARVETGATPLRSKREYYDGNVAWITSGALNRPFVDSAQEFITTLALEETNAKLFPVGTLLVAMYGEGKTRGKISELRIEAATNQACAALVFDETASLTKPYLKVFFEKNYGDIRALASGGVQPNLNLSIVKHTAVPLPPLPEQLQIIEEVDRALSITNKNLQTIEITLRHAERLRQSILKQAFEGKLVPQNPNDEPAGLLIERIKQARTNRQLEKLATARTKRRPTTKKRNRRNEKAVA